MSNLHIGEPNLQGMARTYRNHYPSRIDRKIRSLEADVIYSNKANNRIRSRIHADEDIRNWENTP